MKQQTLLQGNIRRELLALAAPLFAGSILQQLYNTADSLIVGQFMGIAAFASTGVSGTIMNLFIFMLNGFCTGLSILFGQSYGAGDLKDFRRTLFTALTFGSGLTVVLSGLFLALLGPVLRLISTPDELMVYCLEYLRLIVAGLICTYLYNLLSGLLQSVGDTRAGLVFLFASVCGNIVMDLLFIAVFGMGIRGAALATVLAQLFSALGCFFYLRKTYPALLCRREDAALSPPILKKTLRFGLTSALHQSSLYIGKLLVQGAVNGLGTSAIAAFTAATRVEGFANSFGDSGSQAMTIFLSQNAGAHNQDRVRGGFRRGLVLMVCVSLPLAAVMYGFAPGLTGIFLGDDTDALSAGVAYLRMVAPFYILCFVGSAFVGYYRGVGRVFVPFAGTTMHLTLRVVLSYALAAAMGLRAVALATGLGWLLVVAYQSLLYFSARRKQADAQ